MFRVYLVLEVPKAENKGLYENYPSFYVAGIFLTRSGANRFIGERINSQNVEKTYRTVERQLLF
jgi:hypothetical protein